MTDQAARIREVLLAARELAAARDGVRAAAGERTGRLLPAPAGPLRIRLADFLTHAGIDTETAERELAPAREESRRRLAEVRAGAQRQSARHADQLRAVLRARRDALEAVAVPAGPASTQYVALDSPVEIWTTDQLPLSSSSILPWNSRATVDFDGEIYGSGWQYAILGSAGTEELHFYFLWHNPRDASAIVTVDGYLVLNGFCTVHSRGGTVDGGSAALTLDPTLELLQTWTQPISSPPGQPGQTQRALDLAVDSLGWFTDDHTKTAIVYRGFDLRYEQAIVPPDQYLIIDVALAISYSYINGAASADFASAAFDVLCPFVQLAILP